MKRSKKNFMQGALVGSSILALSSLVVGCGDKSSNPDAVSVTELKFPGALTIKDHGNGEVSLQWSGSNNESDFDGYNVYGMKDTDGKLSTGYEGKAIQLLDEKGEPIEKERQYLALYNYGATDKLEKAAVAAASLAESETASTDSAKTPEFSALPIHTLDGTAPVLPTCQPSADGTCGATTAGKKDVVLNGTISYKVPHKLTVGEKYCFVVLSSMDGGTKVSQTSSNVACVVSDYVTEFDITMPTKSSENLVLNLKEYLDSCIAGSCDGSKFFATDGGDHTAASAGPVYIERNGSGESALHNLVAGEGVGVVDLGLYENGLTDESLPKVAPKLVLGEVTYNNGDGTAPVINNGYSIAGQSVVVDNQHVYILTSKGTAEKKFFYHWMSVKSYDKNAAKMTVNVRSVKNEM